MSRKPRKKTPLITPILWFITTGIWTVTFFYGWVTDVTPEGLLILQGLTVLTSLGAALANLYRWKRDRKDADGR